MAKYKENETVIDIERIMQMIPHRYPILLVDKLVEIIPGESAIGIKNVTFNEPHFNGHFPSKPIMPGVLIVEAMAQTAAVLVVETLGEDVQGKLVYFMSIESAKFRRPVVPGDTLYIEVKKMQNHKSVWKFKAEAKVDGKKSAEAIITAMISDAVDKKKSS